MDRLAALQDSGLLKPGHELPVLNLLEISKWVDDWIPAKIDELAFYFKSYVALPGAVLLQEGEETNFFGVFCEGKANVMKQAQDGPKVLQTIGVGKLFGEIAFFDKGTCSASIVVTEPTSILVISEERFDYMCKQTPYLALDITQKIILALTQRLRESSGRLVEYL